MRETFIIPTKARILALVLIAIGVLAIVIGFAKEGPGIWSLLLINNFYFLSLAMGAMFFVAIQYVTDSGWATMFKRIPEAMTSFVPAALIVMVVMAAGVRDLYEWAHHGITETDPLIAHKAPYLNIPFFYARLALFFGLWILLIAVLRRFSLREDASEKGEVKWFLKSRKYSRVFIFVFVVTFSVASFDWIMSIDAHWFSTIFGLRAIISAFYAAVAAIILLTLWLNRTGYLPEMNKYHRSDFARYLFRLSIVWGYLWFIQYLIIWYANIPESTVYFVPRVEEPWRLLFRAEYIINWAIPFVVMMSDDIGRKKAVLIIISILLLVGFYVTLFLQVMPGTGGASKIGFIGIGSFVGFAGLFILLFMYTLSKASLKPDNHPFLEESLHHHL